MIADEAKRLARWIRKWTRRIGAPIRFTWRVLRYYTGALWYGDLFPLGGIAVWDHGEYRGRLGGIPRVIGRLMAFQTVATWEAFRLLNRFHLAIPVAVVSAWIAMAWAGLFWGPVGELLRACTGILLPAVGAVLAVALFLGGLRARTRGHFKGLRYYFYRRVLGVETAQVNPVGVEALADALTERMAQQMEKKREEEISAAEAAAAARADAARAARLQRSRERR